MVNNGLAAAWLFAVTVIRPLFIPGVAVLSIT